MKKRNWLVLSSILVASLFLLTACGTQSTPKNTPSVSKTPSATASSAPLGKVVDGSTILADGLVIPPLGQPIPLAPSIPGHPEFSSAYLNGAYAFALGFVYRSYNIPNLWEPNTKKNPKYSALLSSDFANFASYLTPELQQAFIKATPNLISPIAKASKKGLTLKPDAQLWGHLILLPMRSSNGSLDFLSNPTYYSLMYPWTLGYSVGAPLTSVATIDKYGKVLNVQFKYSIELVYGDQKHIKTVWKLNKTASFDIISNPDVALAKSNPYLIAGFGQANDATFTPVSNDPRLSAIERANPSTPRYP